MKKLFATILLILCGLVSLTSTNVAWPQGTRPGASARPVINTGLPFVSPDGSHIAFVSDRGGATDLFVISSDGTGERQLTRTPEYESPAGWTTDSKHILFSVFTNETSTLYAIGLDGPGGKSQQEIGRFSGRSPVPSPDGKRVVYMAGTWTATRLMVSARDGSKPQQITDGSSIAWNTHWSLDGNRLAFTGRPEPRSELAIFVLNADGSERRQITHIAPEEGGAQWPVWSPDDKQLAVQVNNRASKNSAYIWIVDVATGAAQKLGVHDRAYLDETPSWFPDGKRIAFQSDRTGRMEIWIMNADGSGQTQVTR
jgi:Tol biopolymer transport system component